MNNKHLTDDQIFEIGYKWAEKIASLSDVDRLPYDQWAIDNNVAELLKKLDDTHKRVQQHLNENKRNSI